MKKLYLLSLLLVTALFTQAQSIEQTYCFGNPQITSKGAYVMLSFENTFLTGIPGEPVLPYNKISLLLPPGQIATEIEFSGADLVELDGNYTLYPQQHSQPLSKGKSGNFIKNQHIYGMNSDYPVTPTGTFSTEYMNGYAFVLSSFTPVIYNPASGKLSYYKNVTITVTTERSPVSQQALIMLRSSPSVQEKVRHSAQNQEMLETYPQAPAKREGEYQILIITPTLFEIEYQDLIDLYLTRGMKSEVVTTEYISGAIAGQDLQEKMRNYIIQEYTNHGIEYVLLGGDVEYVPYRGFYCMVQSSSVYEDDNIPSDLYYAGLDGTWNDNGNNLWGEIGEDDLLQDIAIARMPVSNMEELNHMLNKTISYQNSPVSGELRRPLLAGEFLYSNPDTWGSDYLDLLIGYHDDNGYVTDGIPEDHEYETLYEENIAWNGTMLIAKINEGKSFVHHSGHANSDYVMHLYTSDITDANFYAVNGIDHNFTQIFTHGCICGSFESNDCIGEKMVTISNFASVFIGNSRYGWFNEGQTEGPAAHLHRELVDALYHDKLNRAGKAYMETRIATSPWVNAPGQWEEGALRWNFYCCNVLGDPAMAIWTDEPLDIQATYPSALPIGVTSMNVTVTANGLPVQGLRCTVMKDDLFYGVGITNSNGETDIVFEEPFTELGDASLIITGYNCLPTWFPFTIIPNEGAWVIFDTYEINDSEGNGNGQADYGENIKLSVGIINVGTQTANNVDVTLTCADENISITDNHENYGDIQGGAGETIEDAFTFQVSSSVPDQHVATFNLEITGQETWISGFSIIINAPQLVIGNISVNDAQGNGDGKLDPGENAEITIESANMGHSDCENVIATLSSASPWLTINNNSFEIGELLQGSAAYATFGISVNESTPIGTNIDLIFQLASGDYLEEKAFVLTVGIIDEDFETADFESFGWEFGGQLPWTICETQPYEGVYCAKSGNIGDSQSSEMMVTMKVLSADSISFFRKVSSEYDYDFLEFYIDNNIMGQWSGEVQWGRVAFPVQAGEHTFKWVYEKDVYVTGGEDCAWVDYIIFPPVELPVGIQYQERNIHLDLYPNPFTSSLYLQFKLPESSKITIDLYTVSGQMIEKIFESTRMEPGYHQVRYDAAGMEKGIYFVRFESETSVVTRRIVRF